MTLRMRSTLQAQAPLVRASSTRPLKCVMVAVMLLACSAKRASAWQGPSRRQQLHPLSGSRLLQQM